MSWYKDLLGKLKEKFKSTVETKGPEEQEEEIEEDTREILTDRHGEDLICPLCENQDNETGKYFPIRKGDKISAYSDNWHKGCIRVFRKAARNGGLA